MSYKLQRRRKYLSTILLFLNRLQATITFRKDDILGVNEPVGKFTGKIIAIVYRKDDIEEIVFNLADDELAPLKNAENNYYEKIIENLNFNNKDRELLSSFFKDLGTTDIDGELSHIKMYQELFSEQYKLSKEDIKNKGKLYRMLGLFSGLAFVVLFI